MLAKICFLAAFVAFACAQDPPGATPPPPPPSSSFAVTFSDADAAISLLADVDHVDFEPNPQLIINLLEDRSNAELSSSDFTREKLASAIQYAANYYRSREPGTLVGLSEDARNYIIGSVYNSMDVTSLIANDLWSDSDPVVSDLVDDLFSDSTSSVHAFLNYRVNSIVSVLPTSAFSQRTALLDALAEGSHNFPESFPNFEIDQQAAAATETSVYDVLSTVTGVDQTTGIIEDVARAAVSTAYCTDAEDHVECADATAASAYFTIAERAQYGPPMDRDRTAGTYDMTRRGEYVIWTLRESSVGSVAAPVSTTTGTVLIVVGVLVAVIAIGLLTFQGIKSRDEKRALSGQVFPKTHSVIKVKTIDGPAGARAWTESVEI